MLFSEKPVSRNEMQEPQNKVTAFDSVYERWEQFNHSQTCKGRKYSCGYQGAVGTRLFRKETHVFMY